MLQIELLKARKQLLESRNRKNEKIVNKLVRRIRAAEQSAILKNQWQ